MDIKSYILKRTLITGLSVIALGAPALASTQPAIAATNSKTSAQAVAWVKSKIGTGIDHDGYSGNQCVDLAKAYYAYLGNKPVLGNGADYTWNSLPSGWTRHKGVQPKKGDILVYTGGYGGYGHVAIYENDYSTYHQNWNSHSYVERVTYKYNGNFGISYWGVIRPDFTTAKSSGTSAANSTTTSAKTGLYKVNGVWKYLTNGKVNTSYIGLAKNSKGWWYIKNGRIDYSYTGMAKSPKNGKWVYVTKGKTDSSYTGLAKSPSTGKWYYMKNGVLDTSYTGLARSPVNKKLYYVKKGVLDRSFSGKVRYNGKVYTVKKGVVY